MNEMMILTERKLFEQNGITYLFKVLLNKRDCSCDSGQWERMNWTIAQKQESEQARQTSAFSFHSRRSYSAAN